MPLDIGGYYNPDPVKLDKAMRPSKIFNDLMDIYWLYKIFNNLT